MFSIEYLQGEAPMSRVESQADIAALALAEAVLEAKRAGADRVRLFDQAGVIIDDFKL